MAQRIEAAGIAFAYEDTGGAGPAVLFLHGLGGSANGWLAQLEACRERGWRGVAYDQRGAGRSEVPAGPYSVELWAKDAERLLDALAIRSAALVGHSVGCMTAERAASPLGDRVWALALCGGAARWPDQARPVFEERAGLARSGRMDEIAEAVAAAGLSERCRREDPRLLGLMREAIASNDGEAYALWAEATAEGKMEGLDALRCPLLAFCGSEDPVTPPQASLQIAAAAPDGRAATVAGAAHWCMLEDPEGTNNALFAFLDEYALDV
ncbi:MAG: alpha/beta hydrolase [Actinomycetota bacterium]